MGKDHKTKFIGLDAHQNSITIAIADSGSDGEVRLYGTIKNTTKLCLAVTNPRISVAQPSLQGFASVNTLDNADDLLTAGDGEVCICLTLSDISVLGSSLAKNSSD